MTEKHTPERTKYNPLNNIREIWDESSPIIPQKIYHSIDTEEDTLPDGKPAKSTRARSNLWVGVKNSMSVAIRKGLVDPGKQEILNEFHDHFTAMCNRPRTIPDEHEFVPPVYPSDIEIYNRLVIQFLKDTPFEIHNP